MQLKQDADGHDLDPADPDNWTVPTPIYRNDASLLNGNKQLAATASGGVGMSLDMTYFQDADGRSYYAWPAARCHLHRHDGSEGPRPM